MPEGIADSEGYAISQQKRKLIEQGFGWAKTVGHMRQVLVRGIKKVDQMFVLTMAGYNLTRLRSLGQSRRQGRVGGKKGEKTGWKGQQRPIWSTQFQDTES